jgi:hypothetical protein
VRVEQFHALLKYRLDSERHDGVALAPEVIDRVVHSVTPRKAGDLLALAEEDTSLLFAQNSGRTPYEILIREVFDRLYLRANEYVMKLTQEQGK